MPSARLGGGVALSVRHDPTRYWSKALGFGLSEPVTARLMERLVDFYRSEGTPMTVLQIAPSALPPDWPELAADLGLRGGTAWYKLAAPLDRIRPEAKTRLRIAPVRPEDGDQWARTVLRGFGMPEDTFSAMLAGCGDNPDFTPFAAWDGDRIVAGGNLFIHGPIASLNAGATLPSHYNQGAQSALIAARVKAAYDAGCTWVVAETGRPDPGEVNHSLSNLERAGLRPLYARENWLWTNPDLDGVNGVVAAATGQAR
jgi:GNAT superfamily N-acetyltransferase